MARVYYYFFINKGKPYHNMWITDLKISKENAGAIARVGRIGTQQKDIFGIVIFFINYIIFSWKVLYEAIIAGNERKSLPILDSS